MLVCSEELDVTDNRTGQMLSGCNNNDISRLGKFKGGPGCQSIPQSGINAQGCATKLRHFADRLDPIVQCPDASL